MNQTSKSALKVKQIITIFSIFVILATSLPFFLNNQSESVVAKQSEPTKQTDTIVEDLQGSLPTIEVADNYKRTIEPTSRYGKERTIVNTNTTVQTENTQPITMQVAEEPAVSYISIEEITISKNMDLTVRCGVSKADFKQLMKSLKVDRSGFFYKNSDIFYDLCEKYQINEIFFCGLIAAESGWNIAASHRNTHNYISMMSKGKLIKYASDKQGLEAAAKLLHNKYLTKGGSCYSGKTLAGVQKRFCPNSSTWVNLVYGCMKQVVK